MQTVFIGATLIDGMGSEPVAGADVIMRKGKMREAGRTGRESYSHDAHVIDVAFLTPLHGPFGADFRVADWLPEPLGGSKALRRAVAERT